MFFPIGLSGLAPDYAIGPEPVRCAVCEDPVDLPRSLADAGWKPLCGRARCMPARGVAAVKLPESWRER